MPLALLAVDIVERLVFDNNHNRILALARDFSRVSKLARFSGIDTVKGDVLDLHNLINVTKDCDIIFHYAYGNRVDRKYQRHVTVEGTRKYAKQL